MNSQLNSILFAASCPRSVSVALLAGMLAVLVLGGLALAWLVCALLSPAIESRMTSATPDRQQAETATVIDISVLRQMRESDCRHHVLAE